MALLSRPDPAGPCALLSVAALFLRLGGSLYWPFVVLFIPSLAERSCDVPVAGHQGTRDETGADGVLPLSRGR